MITTDIQNAAILPQQGKTIKFNYDKAEIIDYVFSRCSPKAKSFADLGGVWGVDGAYTLYALRKHQVERACLVDTHFNDRVKAAADQLSNLHCIEGNFGDPLVAQRVGKVDAIFMFDVLLHQVNPHWDDVMELYADRARYLVILNQQWPGQETTRLLDLGPETYLNTVPGALGNPVYATLFDKINDIHPHHNRPWRDVHHIWQWGIVDSDIIATAERLGFKMLFYKDCGYFPNSTIFRNRAFVFEKQT